jgi:hypothetical protein
VWKPTVEGRGWITAWWRRIVIFKVIQARFDSVELVSTTVKLLLRGC